MESINGYTVLSKAGNGTQSTVYKGQKDDNYFALKRLNLDDKYLKRELKILSNLNLPYCISLIDSFKDSKSLQILVFKYYPINLHDFINNSSLNFSQCQKWAKQLCIGLSQLHKNNIIHRDLKPANILLTEDSPNADIVIADFGLSINTILEPARTSLGTFGFFAPEILERNYTNKVDVYSFGVVIYFMMFKDFPSFTDGVPDEPKECLDIGLSRIWRFLRKALEKDPKKRPSFEELLKDPFFVERKDSRGIIERSKGKFKRIYKVLSLLEVKNKEIFKREGKEKAKFIDLVKCFCFMYIKKYLEVVLAEYSKSDLFEVEVCEGIQMEFNYFDRESLRILKEQTENNDMADLKLNTLRFIEKYNPSARVNSSSDRMLYSFILKSLKSSNF